MKYMSYIVSRQCFHACLLFSTDAELNTNVNFDGSAFTKLEENWSAYSSVQLASLKYNAQLIKTFTEPARIYGTGTAPEGQGTYPAN